MISLDSNETKKLLAHMYNEVSKEMFGVGTILLKVTVDFPVITFQAKHRRSPRSDALEGEAPNLKQEVDFHLSLLYKKKLLKKLTEKTDWKIEAVLRDFDAKTQLAFTNIVLKEENQKE
ncbi:DUF2294 domain-containing protein [Bacillaceae bacterium Marseille-Q3522]|nr:DUF2294 domain-containing protein [Bacillaceae bacterium Marseille-Q3522]